MTRRARLTIAACVILAAPPYGCTREAQRAAVHVADAACEVVSLATDQPIAEQVCLVEREVGDTLERVLDAQKRGATTMPLDVHTPSGVRTVRLVKLPVAEAELRRARARFGVASP